MQTKRRETYSKDGANEHAVVLAESALITLGEGNGELLCRVGLVALQGLESEVKTTTCNKRMMTRRALVE